ncbi:MAG: hypothetical protein QM778_03820 [Myxococcales bacterium]
MRAGWVALVFCITLGVATRAQAGDFFGLRSDDAPSLSGDGYRGLLAGSLVGLSGGYVAARRHGFDSSDWKPMVYGLGFGALGGLAVGLTLGAFEIRDPSRKIANLTLREMVCAGALGTLTGAIVGGLVAIGSREPEHILFGAAIGTLGGVGTGLVVGVVQGSFAAKKAARQNEHARRPSIGPSWAMVADAQHRRVLMVGAEGRF